MSSSPTVPSTPLATTLDLILSGATSTALALATGNPALVITYGSQLVGALLHVLENHGAGISVADLSRWQDDAADRALRLAGAAVPIPPAAVAPQAAAVVEFRPPEAATPPAAALTPPAAEIAQETPPTASRCVFCGGLAVTGHTCAACGQTQP